MKTEPTKEAAWLQQLVGDWTIEGAATAGPGKPPERWKGSERVRSLGGLWIVGEGKGDMPGLGQAEMLLTIGYDPEKRRYVGSWVGSMMTHLWVYEGELDASGKALTLHCEGPDMANPGAMVRYKDVYTVTGPDTRTLTSHMLGPDGGWHQFMTAEYRRKAKPRRRPRS